MTPETPPWWATATSVPPPNWTDLAAWEALPPPQRMAAWTEYRLIHNDPKEHNQ